MVLVSNKKHNSRIVIVFLLFTFGTLNLFAVSKPDALVLYKKGFHKKAIAVCEQELKENPKNIESFVVMSWALLASGQYKRAYETTVKARKIAHSEPRLIEAQAEACYYLGKNEESLRLFENYIFYAPSGLRISNSYYFMGEVYLRLAKYRHADIAFSTAVKLSSYNSLWWTRLGYAREQTRDYRYSLEAYNKALSLNKNLVDAQKGRDRVLKKF